MKRESAIDPAELKDDGVVMALHDGTATFARVIARDIFSVSMFWSAEVTG